ncbi:MAG: serine protease [Planctomycetaceae bacterium]|jgi:hypothetical protein|nr:serine protease [Planctomycetaceae bacterium]
MRTISRDGCEAIIFDDDEIKAVQDYWTEERIRNAIPLPMPILSGQSETRHEEYVKETPQEADVNSRPFWNGGRLTMTESGKDYFGSAQFYSANNIILTAAHCVRKKDTGLWLDNVALHRAYKNGGGQTVTTRVLATKTAWVNSDNPYKYDYAFAISNELSGKGFFNDKLCPQDNTFTAIGYPSNYGSGQTMQRVGGTKGNVTNGIVQMLGNPMKQGCSGGGWISDLSASTDVGKNYVVGLNSHGFESEPNNLYGPLFDDEFEGLLEFIKTLI